MGVGYIIGPKLGALNFSGGLLAWGLLVPHAHCTSSGRARGLAPGTGVTCAHDAWMTLANPVWTRIVRPIAIGGMLMGAGFTLFKMRKSLAVGPHALRSAT